MLRYSSGIPKTPTYQGFSVHERAGAKRDQVATALSSPAAKARGHRTDLVNVLLSMQWLSVALIGLLWGIDLGVAWLIGWHPFGGTAYAPFDLEQDFLPPLVYLMALALAWPVLNLPAGSCTEPSVATRPATPMKLHHPPFLIFVDSFLGVAVSLWFSRTIREHGEPRSSMSSPPDSAQGRPHKSSGNQLPIWPVQSVQSSAGINDTRFIAPSLPLIR